MPRIDTAALLERVDLLDLAGRDTKLHKVSGSEYAGPCPKCGGNDRFHLDAAARWWFCRQCHDKRDSAIGYLMWRDGLGFVDASAALAGGELPTAPAPQRPRAPAQAEPEPPGELWQHAANGLVAWAETELWRSPAALAYLRGRGLTDASIRDARLGYIPAHLERPAAKWGLPKPVHIRQGWLIPCYMGGALWYAKVRQERPEPSGPLSAKYLALAGSHKKGAVFGLDLLPPGAADVVLIEGELNALVLRQCLAPVCGVLSIGDAGNIPGGAAMPALARARRLLALLDQDKAGQQGQQRLLGAFARARALSWPWADRGKFDANDALLAGLDLAGALIPQVGPTEPGARGLWARYWLDFEPLDSAAAAVVGSEDNPADLTDPALRLWLAVYGEYGRLGWPEPGG